MTTTSSIKNHIEEIIGSVPYTFEWKAVVAAITASAGWLFGVGNIEILAMLMVLVAIDMSTAVGAELKQGNKLESRKALKTATKALVYGAMVAGAHLTGKVIGIDFLDTITTSFLAVTELISILENVKKMGYAIPSKVLNIVSDQKRK